MAKRFRKNRQVSLLRAFFDESSDSPQASPAFIFGGVVGTAGELELAANAWQECLDEEPSIPHFHHKLRSHRPKIPSLAKVLANSNLQAVIVTVPHTPFGNRNKAAASGRFGSKVYDWAFIAAIMGILNWVDESFTADHAMDFIFDHRREFARCKGEFFDRFRDQGRGVWKRAGTCEHGDDEKIAALQMGDLLAGEVLACIRAGGSASPALLEIAHAKPVLLIRGSPPLIIKQSLALENVGKTLFDSGRRKILEYPSEDVPASIFSKEFNVLHAIETWLKANLEIGPQYESTTERCRIYAIQGRLEIHRDAQP
jgi:hypothetical protein